MRVLASSAIAYDEANERRSAHYGRDGHLERYDYDARGYLTDTTIDGVLRARRVNDQAGRVGDYYEYDAGGALKSSSTRYWDNDSLLMQEHDNQANTGTITYRLNDGTVDFTETYGEATTVKTSYDYVWFDGAKQTQIMVQASNQSVKNWAPGFSRYVYDEQGRIKLAYDQAGNRGFAYPDASLERERSGEFFIKRSAEAAVGHAHIHIHGRRQDRIANTARTEGRIHEYRPPVKDLRQVRSRCGGSRGS